MMLKRRLYLLFAVTLGLLVYGLVDWNITASLSKQNLAEHFKYLKLVNEADQSDHSTRKDFSRPLELVAVKNNSRDAILKLAQQTKDHGGQTTKQGMHSNLVHDAKYRLQNASKESGSVRDSKYGTDDWSREVQINKVINVISKLSNIKEKSHIMSYMRKALWDLPRPPAVPLHLVEKTESSFLSTVVPPVARVSYSETWRGYTLPVITCQPLGRLGNVMGEYATMFALRMLYNASLIVMETMKDRLSDFPHLSLPLLNGTFYKSEWTGVANYGGLYNYAPVELAASGLFGPKPFVMREYAFEMQLFHSFQKELKKEFTFSNATTTKVQNFFRGLIENSSMPYNTDVIFVGFHIRRTDYVKHARNMFGATLPEESYFNRAMDYYRKKFHGKVLFIAASDDPVFIKKTLGKHPDVRFSPGTSAIMDMAVLSSCNHSIITLGSYGFWTGFLTGGEVVYPDVQFKKMYRFSRAMYEKVGLQSFIPLSPD